jgi:hypothetical protein
MVAPTCFGITLTFSLSDPSALLRDAQLRNTHHVTRHNTPIHSFLSTAPQLSISQKALGTLPEDGNVMPKHVGAKLNSVALVRERTMSYHT